MNRIRNNGSTKTTAREMKESVKRLTFYEMTTKHNNKYINGKCKVIKRKVNCRTHKRLLIFLCMCVFELYLNFTNDNMHGDLTGNECIDERTND